MQFGLIGHPLGHSFSKQFFEEKFRRAGIAGASYTLFPLPGIGQFPELLRQNPELRGLNVTIPHKKSVLQFLDELADSAAGVGAVNCIEFREGKLIGHNTDVFGFEQSLLASLSFEKSTDARPELPVTLKGSGQAEGENPSSGLGRPFQGDTHLETGNHAFKALILGTGGAAAAVRFVLQKLGIAYQTVSRTPNGAGEIGYPALNNLNFNEIDLIVNTTPLGMAPNVDGCPPLPFKQLGRHQLVFDLVYNPTETLLLSRAKHHGCRTKNGLEMLHLQAEKSWDIWSLPVL